MIRRSLLGERVLPVTLLACRVLHKRARELARTRARGDAMPTRSGSRSPRSPRANVIVSPPTAARAAPDDGVQHALKINVPAKTPTDLAAALRELERVRVAQEKSSAAAMAATRRAFDEQAALEKKLEGVEGELARALRDVDATKSHAEREASDARKLEKTLKKKIAKLETKLEEAQEGNARWEARANAEHGSSASALERFSQREIELEDRCARQESALEAMRGQVEELRTTLEREREGYAAKLDAREEEITRARRDLEEALEIAARVKEEADMTVDSMREALEAQGEAREDGTTMEEVRILRERVDELTRSQASTSTSDDDKDKIARLEEKVVALERLLDGERKARATATANANESAERAKRVREELDAERAERQEMSVASAAQRAKDYETVQTRVETLEAEVAASASIIADLKKMLDCEKEASANAKTKAANEIQSIRNTSKTAERAIATANSAMDAAESRAVEAEKSASERDVMIRDLRVEMESLRVREKDLVERLVSSSANDSDQLNAKEAAIIELKGRLVEVERASSEVAGLKDALVAATNAAATAAKSIEDRETELRDSRQKIALIEKDLRDARDAAERATKDVEFRDAQVRDLTRDLQTMKKRMKDAENNLQVMTLSASSTNAEDDEERNQLALELQTATSLADAADIRAAGLELQLKIADDARDEAVAKSIRLMKELEIARETLADIEALRGVSEQLLEENARLAEELEQSREVSAELINARADVERLTKDLTAAMNSLKASKAAASRAVQEAVSASSKRAHDLAKELEQVQKQFEDGKSKLENYAEDVKRANLRVAELEMLVDTLRSSLETAERDAATKTNDKLDMEYMRREEDLRAEISDLVLELQDVKDDALEKVEAADRRVAALESQLEEVEVALTRSRETVRTLSVETSAKDSGSAHEMSELRRKLVDAQEIAASASGNTEAVKRRYEARLRDASELADKQISSLSKELESAKRTIELAEKAKEHAKLEIKRAEDAFALKAKAHDEQIDDVRKKVDFVNAENLKLLDKLKEARDVHEDLKKQRDTMEADLVETCTILEKVSEKASLSADEYKKSMEQFKVNTNTLRETLESEVLATMERVEEKELIIKDMETREAERSAQIELLQEKLLTNAADLKSCQAKLKDATAGERERLIVLQTENSRLEKRLTDTWAALQGAHAVVEQTKIAAKKAVAVANGAAAKAEQVALKAKQELEDIRNGRRDEAEKVTRLQAQLDEFKGKDAAARAELERVKAEKEKDIEIARQRRPIPTATRVRTPVTLDDEMMRASDLLERLGRSRESSIRDETESLDRVSNHSASFRSFGYGGASSHD